MVPKFRAWDIKYKMMMRVNQIDFEKKTVWLEADNGDHENRHTLTREFKDVIFMQFTGLKDKNGVEIFEGDIVFDRWANGYTPVFQNGIYMAYNPKNLMQNDPSTQFNIIWKDGCEVIGNIYENPELLEQADEN